MARFALHAPRVLQIPKAIQVLLLQPSIQTSFKHPGSFPFLVAVRNQMSTLKHSIRHQQAQLHGLENIILRGSRPLPPGFMASSHSPHPSSDDVLDISPCPVAYTTSFSTPKMQRRSSFDVLQGLAGRESNLPLPRRESATPILKRDGIREGIPMDFGGSPGNAINTKRMSSPTRTLSRMSTVSL